MEELEDEEEEEAIRKPYSMAELKRKQTTAVVLLGVIGAEFGQDITSEGTLRIISIQHYHHFFLPAAKYVWFVKPVPRMYIFIQMLIIIECVCLGFDLKFLCFWILILFIY